MARFVPLIDQPQGPQFVPSAVEPPPLVPPTPEEAGARSAARAPGTQPEPRSQLPPSQRELLRAAGVQLDEAPFGAQFQFGLGAPAAEAPEQKVQLAQRILGKSAEVQIEPQTGQVIFRQPGQEQFQAFNLPGPSVGDITRFAPEAGVLGAGVAGGLTGGVAGATGGPFLGGAGVVAGEGLGEALGEALRLTEAVEQGLVDLTPNQILQQAATRGGGAAVGTVLGGAVVGSLRRLLAGRLGVDAEVLQAFGDRPLSEVRQQAAHVQGRVRGETGQDLPLSLGQQSQSPELLRAEQAALRQREPGGPLRDIETQQQRAVGALEERTFGQPAGPLERQVVGEELIARGQQQAGRAETMLGEAEQRAFGRAPAPETAVARTRQQIEQGRERVFAPLRQQFDELQQERGIVIDLTPLRVEAARLRSEEGQDILRNISLQEQSRLLSEAERAGLTEVERLELGPGDLLEFVRRPESVPRTLGEVQRLLRDIRRERRRPGITDEPQRDQILKNLQRVVVRARNDALSPEDLQRVSTLEREFADATNRIDRGIVSDFMAIDPRTRVPTLTSQQSIQQLLRDPEVAQEFVSALGVLPNRDAALSTAQDGVLGFIRDRFLSEETGRIDPRRLRTFLRNRSNREALGALFEGDPGVARNLNNVRRLSNVLEEREKALQIARSRMRRAVGLDTADPAVLASTALREVSPQDAMTMRRLLPPERRELFDRALATDIRATLADQRGRLSPDAIDQFLQSDRSLVTNAVLGQRFNRNLGLLRDTLRQVDRSVDPNAPQDLARVFDRNVTGLEGLMRFMRVPFAPLSVRGRALTATLGVSQERSRERLAEVLADPERLNDLAGLAGVSLRSRRAELILGRLGFEGFLEVREAAEPPETR